MIFPFFFCAFVFLCFVLLLSLFLVGFTSNLFQLAWTKTKLLLLYRLTNGPFNLSIMRPNWKRLHCRPYRDGTRRRTIITLPPPPPPPAGHAASS
jgi:hypothetical protein